MSAVLFFVFRSDQKIVDKRKRNLKLRYVCAAFRNLNMVLTASNNLNEVVIVVSSMTSGATGISRYACTSSIFKKTCLLYVSVRNLRCMVANTYGACCERLAFGNRHKSYASAFFGHDE